ncbi:MAG TPA: SDR family oxidoreductase [Solirubrobacteraceae bacterium]|nr:SDR family oxidoreductase [Solirubrobacteraceae bacterium]
MSTINASELLRPGLLEGVSILLAGAPAISSEGSSGGRVGVACTGLGARVYECQLAIDAPVGGADDAVERAAHDVVERALDDAGGVQLLVIDAASVFAAARDAGERGEAPDAMRDALRECLDVSWNVTRAVAERAFLTDARGGRIVYLAPRGDAGEHAHAARAGLENLARTLSIEWARHGITAVAIAPGIASAAEIAALIAYLASPAGAYFSGCLLDLTGTELP